MIISELLIAFQYAFAITMGITIGYLTVAGIVITIAVLLASIFDGKLEIDTKIFKIGKEKNVTKSRK